MKQMLLVAFLLIGSLGLQAQITVDNRTPCDYYYELISLNTTCADVANYGGIVPACSSVLVNTGGLLQYRIRVSFDGINWSSFSGGGGSCTTPCIPAPPCSGTIAAIWLNTAWIPNTAVINDNGCFGFSSCF